MPVRHALIFGLVIGNLVKPGAGFDINPQTLATGAEAVAEKTSNGELPHTVDFLLNIIPTSVISAFAENALLQVRQALSTIIEQAQWLGSSRSITSKMRISALSRRTNGFFSRTATCR